MGRFMGARFTWRADLKTIRFLFFVVDALFTMQMAFSSLVETRLPEFIHNCSHFVHIKDFATALAVK